MKQIGIFNQYPHRPGWKKRDTSRQAAEQISVVVTGLQSKVLEFIRSGPASADELASYIEISILSARPRCSELAKMGLIEDSGERRANESGKMAIVWKMV